MKAKTCKVCKTKFEPTFNAIQPCCSIPCAITHANNLKAKRLVEKAKKERQEYRIAKEKQKTKRDYANEIDKLHQRYARYIDADDGCISCGKACSPDGNESDGGHYISRSNRYLRWHPDNCHKQCKHCNNALKGNYPEYRKGLILKIGLERVEYLENCKEPAPRYTIDELKAIIAEYKLKLKQISNA